MYNKNVKPERILEEEYNALKTYRKISQKAIDNVRLKWIVAEDWHR